MAGHRADAGHEYQSFEFRRGAGTCGIELVGSGSSQTPATPAATLQAAQAVGR